MNEREADVLDRRLQQEQAKLVPLPGPTWATAHSPVRVKAWP
jgi:hypothetical protein